MLVEKPPSKVMARAVVMTYTVFLAFSIIQNGELNKPLPIRNDTEGEVYF